MWGSHFLGQIFYYQLLLVFGARSCWGEGDSVAIAGLDCIEGHHSGLGVDCTDGPWKWPDGCCGNTRDLRHALYDAPPGGRGIQLQSGMGSWRDKTCLPNVKYMCA